MYLLHVHYHNTKHDNADYYKCFKRVLYDCNCFIVYSVHSYDTMPYVIYYNYCSFCCVFPPCTYLVRQVTLSVYKPHMYNIHCINDIRECCVCDTTSIFLTESSNSCYVILTRIYYNTCENMCNVDVRKIPFLRTCTQRAYTKQNMNKRHMLRAPYVFNVYTCNFAVMHITYRLTFLRKVYC